MHIEPKMQFLTAETFEALEFTSRSTAKFVRYLLDQGLLWVKTRSLNSDPVESVESTISEIRRICGDNDDVDGRSAIFGMERMLRIGTPRTSKYANAGAVDGVRCRGNVRRPVVSNIVSLYFGVAKRPGNLAASTQECTARNSPFPVVRCLQVHELGGRVPHANGRPGEESLTTARSSVANPRARPASATPRGRRLYAAPAATSAANGSRRSREGDDGLAHLT